MPEVFSIFAAAVAVFASTNVDDLLLLAAFFSDPSIPRRAVIWGQFLGIGALVLVSAAAGLAAVVVPEGYTALLGIFPLLLGLRALLELLRRRDSTRTKATPQEEKAGPTKHRSHLFSVAAVTVANGGDNLGVYIPLFASDPSAIPTYVAVFAAMTALWLWISSTLVHHPAFGYRIRELGHRALPFVLVLLGLWILSGVRVLLR